VQALRLCCSSPEHASAHADLCLSVLPWLHATAVLHSSFETSTALWLQISTA
jgi:hypothetical protein